MPIVSVRDNESNRSNRNLKKENKTKIEKDKGGQEL